MKPRYSSEDEAGLAKGFRSGLEDVVAAQLTRLGFPVNFETHTIRYVVPPRNAKYTPDFPQPNGVIIETKGRFEAEDRQKHLLVKAQHPDLDIRFVFSRSKTPIRKGSKTTYADWCRKYGYQFADKLVPEAWLNEAPELRRVAAMRAWLKGA